MNFRDLQQFKKLFLLIFPMWPKVLLRLVVFREWMQRKHVCGFVTIVKAPCNKRRLETRIPLLNQIGSPNNGELNLRHLQQSTECLSALR